MNYSDSSDDSDSDNSSALFPCLYCLRTFNLYSLKRHQPICQRIQSSNKKLSENRTINSNQKGIKEDDCIILTEILNQKNKRRHRWRKDHKRFLRNIMSLKENDETVKSQMDIDVKNEMAFVNYNNSDNNVDLMNNKKILNSNKISSQRLLSNILEDTSLEIPGEPMDQELNKKKLKMKYRTKSVFDDYSNCPELKLNEESSEQTYCSLMNKFKNVLKTEDVDLFKQLMTNVLNDPLSSQSNETVKISPVKPKSDIKILDGHMKRTKSNYELCCQNEDSKNSMPVNETMKQYNCSKNKQMDDYLIRVNKAIDYYNVNCWNNNSQKSTKISEEIPKHLSSQKYRLEQFKKANLAKATCREDVLVKYPFQEDFQHNKNNVSIDSNNNKEKDSYISNSQCYQKNVIVSNDETIIHPKMSLDYTIPYANRSLDRIKQHMNTNISNFDNQSQLKSNLNNLIKNSQSTPNINAEINDNYRLLDNYDIKLYVDQRLDRFKQSMNMDKSDSGSKCAIQNNQTPSIGNNVNVNEDHKIAQCCCTCSRVNLSNHSDTNGESKVTVTPKKRLENESCIKFTSGENIEEGDKKFIQDNYQSSTKTVAKDCKPTTVVPKCKGVEDLDYLRAWKVKLNK